MIRFTAHASSSTGNLYEVTDGEARLVIDVGVGIAAMRRALRHTVASLDGVLVSHFHGDHSRAVTQVMRAGVDVYASAGTWAGIGERDAMHHRAHRIVSGQLARIGPWSVKPFDVVHDAHGATGFLVRGPSGETLLYAIDTAYVPVKADGVSVFAVECNWNSERLHQASMSGVTDARQVRRVVNHHMSLERVLDMVAANDLSNTREIHLLHMSDDNADEDVCVAAVRRATGKPVFAAPRNAIPPEVSIAEL